MCSWDNWFIIRKRDVGVPAEVHKEGALPHRAVTRALASQNVKFKTAFRNCVHKVFSAREWRETDSDDFQIMWCEKEQI